MVDEPALERDLDAYRTPSEAHRYGLTTVLFIVMVYMVPFVLFFMLPGQLDWRLIELARWAYIGGIAAYAWYLVMRVRRQSAGDIANTDFMGSAELSRERNEAIFNIIAVAAGLIFYLFVS